MTKRNIVLLLLIILLTALTLSACGNEPSASARATSTWIETSLTVMPLAETPYTYVPVIVVVHNSLPIRTIRLDAESMLPTIDPVCYHCASSRSQFACYIVDGFSILLKFARLLFLANGQGIKLDHGHIRAIRALFPLCRT